MIVSFPVQVQDASTFDNYQFEYEIFGIFANLALTSHHLPCIFQNEYDEISWRLKFFD